MSSPETTNQAGRAQRLLLALLLAAMAIGLYAPTTGYEFVNYDDYDYIVRNRVVQEGLSASGMELALKGGHSTNWHPLTTLSHLLDVELFGIEERGAAGAHHRSNILLHGLNAALCFLALFGMTRRLWLAALVAALFALHPQRVESVAWISERKDLLSGTFFFLTLMAWTRYAKRGGRGAYSLACVTLALGLMSKQMLVTLPFVLVLMDMGALGRWKGNSESNEAKAMGALLVEKLPMIALSVLSIIPMWMAQTGGGTMGNLGLGVRLENALASCYRYVAQMFWPVDLAPFYPHPDLVEGDLFANLHLPAILGSILLLALSALALKRLRTAPLLAAGWFWYLGMLVPVIGLVQVGSQSHADRYTYLPSIGLYLMLALGLCALVRRKPALARPVQVLCVLTLASLAFLSAKQIPIWKNSRTLNRHALAVTENNYVAHNNYGLYYLEEGSDPVLAAQHFTQALTIRSNFLQAAENLAASYAAQKNFKEAKRIYANILRDQPGNARVLGRLGKLNAATGDSAAAFRLFDQATKSDPSNARNWIELGILRLEREQGIHAEQCAAKALALEPNNTRAHILHSRAARMLGYGEASILRIQAAVDSNPTHVEALLTQCRILAGQRRLPEAEEACAKILRLEPHNVQAHILNGKFLMLRHKSNQMNAQQTSQALPLSTKLFDQAKEQLTMALDDAPDNPEALEFYALLLLEELEYAKAETQLLRALEIRPDFPSALFNLGVIYGFLNQEAKSLAKYKRLMKVASDSPNARMAARSMAWILATSPDSTLRDGAEAVRMGKFAMRSFRELGMDESATFETLAAAFALEGLWEDAVKYQEAAIKLCQGEGQRTVFTKRLELYRAEKTYIRPVK